MKFDHHSEAFSKNMDEFYRNARKECPVFHSESYGGFTVLTRYADIRAALRNHATYFSGRFVDHNGRTGGGVAIPPNAFRIGIIEMDPPEATAVRNVLTPWFSLDAINAGSARIEQLAQWVVDTVIERGGCDVVRDLATPMPSLLILDHLGLPLDRAAEYGPILHQAVAKASGSAPKLKWLLNDLERTITMKEYRDDSLVAALVNAHVQGSRLSLELVAELTMMLLFGGTDTTISAISSAMFHFSENESDRQRVIEHPALLPTAIEEILRLYCPATGVARTVRQPTEVAGVKLSPGDRVLCPLNSGNRDDSVFTHAEEFRLDRPAKPHLAFGAGVHACLGQNLARADLRIYLTEILQRMPDFKVDVAHSERYRSAPLVNGFTAMPVRFTPRERRPHTRSVLPHLTAPRIVPVAL